MPTHTRGIASIDLDLGCMYELTDGTKGVVQPLGALYGSLNSPPFVKLSGDDRFGSPSGETVYVNLDRKDEIKRLLFFVFCADNTPAFARAQAVVTLVPNTGPWLTVSLDEQSPHACSCTVALIEHRKDELVVRHEGRYILGFQSDIDRLYGWGLRWGPGIKPSKS
ncbi:hypothetical protein ACQEU8_19690 [Streptomyces sp. CA-250714]|uniref:hypothetical protein n=1 Tax=Streptomyces sp. CA-250714 TaxID=3240060 RepID=UPI003D908B1A